MSSLRTCSYTNVPHALIINLCYSTDIPVFFLCTCYATNVPVVSQMYLYLLLHMYILLYKCTPEIERERKREREREGYVNF